MHSIYHVNAGFRGDIWCILGFPTWHLMLPRGFELTPNYLHYVLQLTSKLPLYSNLYVAILKLALWTIKLHLCPASRDTKEIYRDILKRYKISRSKWETRFYVWKLVDSFTGGVFTWACQNSYIIRDWIGIFDTIIAFFLKRIFLLQLQYLMKTN